MVAQPRHGTSLERLTYGALGPLPQVSVVVPCRGHAELLASQLEALAAQQTPMAWEVVIVDSGRDEHTIAVIEAKSASLPPTSVVRIAATNAAAARNVGVASSRGRHLLFCDADDVVASGWVKTLAEALEKHEFVAGKLEWSALNADWVRMSRALPQQHGLQQWDGFLPFAGGGNMGISREVYDALGGFDESMVALEDTDLCFRAQVAGHRLHWVPSATVHVRLRASLSGTYRQGRSYGEATVELRRRYAASGMAPDIWYRPLGGWLLALPRLLMVRDRGGLARWVHRLGWRVGALRGWRRRVGSR